VPIRSFLAPVGLGAAALITAALVGAPAAVGGGSMIVASGWSPVIARQIS